MYPFDIRPITRSMSVNIPSAISSGEGCKDDSNVDRFYSRTAGMFYFFRPCGFRLAQYEMYTAESLSSIFVYLIDLFGNNPSSNVLQGIVYDRACDMHPFLQNLSKNGNIIASYYLKLHFMVDIFHVKKHTMEKCQLNNPNCLFHPHLEKYKFVKDMNTETAEQSFAKINPFKNSTRRMTYCKRLLYFKFIDEHENKRLFE